MIISVVDSESRLISQRVARIPISSGIGRLFRYQDSIHTVESARHDSEALAASILKLFISQR